MRPHPGSGGGPPPLRGEQEGMSPQDQEKVRVCDLLNLLA